MRTRTVQTGSDLRHLRQQAGVSIRGLAEAMNHWPRAIERMEHAARPRATTIATYLAGIERVRAEREIERVQRTYERRLAVLDRAKGLVEELARVLVEAAREPRNEKSPESGLKEGRHAGHPTAQV